VKRAPMRPAPRPAVVNKETTLEPAPTAKPNPITQAVPEAKPATADPPKDDCNPPYYYEGSKKVFKPACL